MTTQHKNISEADLHENKGASTASTGQFLVADGVGGSAFSTKLTKYLVTLSPTIVNANTTSAQAFTVTGVVGATDVVLRVSKPTEQTGLGIISARVSADNTVTVQFMNNTAGNITPTASEVYTFIVYRA